MPLTLCCGTIENVEKWNSYRALRKALKTGNKEDIRAVGQAIEEDMQDAKKAEV